VRARVRI